VPLVKNVWVKLSAIGAAETKAALDAVASKARDLGQMDPVITVKAEIGGALAKLAELRFALNGIVRDTLGGVGKDGGGILGLLSKLGGTIPGLSATSGAGGWGSAAVGGGIVAALASGLAGIIPMLLAATAGVGAFAALAMPTFKTVTGAVSTLATDTAAYKTAVGDLAKDQALHKIRQDWAALTPVQTQAVKSIQSLQSVWAGLSAKFAPSFMPVFNEGLKIANTLLPMLLPFAQAAAKAIDGLLKSFEAFAKSPGFAQFRSQLLAMVGPSIRVIATGIGQIVIALGKLVLALANPDMYRAWKTLFTAIADTIQALAWAVRFSTELIVRDYHAIAVAFDFVRGVVANFAHDWAHNFDTVRHAIATAADTVMQNLVGMGRTFASWAATIWHYIMDVVHFFEGLPGQVMSALARLPAMLFQAGKNAVQSLINGLGSMLGSLGSMAASLASKVAGFFGLSPAKEGPLSGMGAPEIRGAHFAQAFAAGMDSMNSQVGAAAGRMGRAAGGGTYGAAGAYAGGGTWRFQIVGGQDAFTQFMATWLRNWVRISGGDPTMFQRKVAFR
jgi:hypothetical protein